MKKLIAILLVIMLIAVGCAPKTPDSPTTGNGTTTDPGEGNAEKPAEPVEYSTIYSGEITTLNYLATSNTNEFGLASNFVDNLVDYNKYGVAEPSLATDWSVSDDGTVWTLKIREGVKWYTYNGEEYAEVTAQDFVDSAEYILNPVNESTTANLLYDVIKNAEAFYDGEITDFSEVGVKAVDKYTLEYTLIKNTPYFLSMLNYVSFLPVHGPYLEEVGELFGLDNSYILYNGAYLLDIFEPQTRRILVKNENYWDKDNIFIDKIRQVYNQEAATLAPEMFVRGETDYADIPSSAVEEWMSDPAKKDLIRPNRTGYYTYFYALNFNPTFDKEFEPDNWKIAVNNRNFRKSIFHALDRVSAMTTAEPYDPEQRLLNTVTPRNFVGHEGVDYTLFPALEKFTNEDSFNENLAVEFRDKAIEELEGKAKFPIIVYMPYNSGGTEWGNRVQVIEQQMENLLGKDYIDIVIDAKPPTNFLSEVRRSGKYAFLEANWGPDYEDPETYSDPFYPELYSYNFPELVEGYVDADGEKTYTNMINRAKAEVNDKKKRYELFSEAEGFLIEEAFIIPYAISGGGYAASRLNPFESQYSPFGVAGQRFKGQKIMDKPMNTDEFIKALEQWEKERANALK